jgi:hypothetical protein
MNRNTAIRGIQIKDGDVGLDQLTSAIGISLGLADSAYQKPGSGITTADLDAGVVSSLGKADSALQELAFIGLTDAPSTYADASLKGVRVTAGADGLEFYTITDAVGILESAFKVEDLTGSSDTTPAPLTDTPVANSVQVYLRGLLQEEGSAKDYTISGKQITFAEATEADDIIVVHYIAQA